jgi:hypothetical protein
MLQTCSFIRSGHSVRYPILAIRYTDERNDRGIRLGIVPNMAIDDFRSQGGVSIVPSFFVRVVALKKWWRPLYSGHVPSLARSSRGALRNSSLPCLRLWSVPHNLCSLQGGPLSSRGSDDWRSITHPAVSVTGTSDRDSNTLFLIAKLLPSVATVFPKSRSMLYYSCFLISSRDSA